jgi:hypothetical protein
MQNDILGYTIMAVFYGGLLLWLFLLVRRHIHPSRSILFGYLASLAILLAVLSVALFSVMALAAATGNMHNPSKVIIAMGVSILVGSVVMGWQLCKSWLGRPSH